MSGISVSSFLFLAVLFPQQICLTAKVRGIVWLGVQQILLMDSLEKTKDAVAISSSRETCFVKISYQS